MYVDESSKGSTYRKDIPPGVNRMLVLLIMERESSFGKLALQYLENDGFSVRTLSMASDAIQQVEKMHPAMVIIETAVSRSRALELCREIRWVRSLARTPVVLLAASASEAERVQGLESGADDYITETSSGREVVARVGAVMRRFSRQDLQFGLPHVSPALLRSLVGTRSPTMRIGDIEIDPGAMKISVRGNEIMTTNLEFRLLYYLLHNQNRVFTREQLLDAVWGAQYVELRSVDACIRRLRRKIEPEPLRPTYLQTIRGAGYCFASSAA